MSNKFSILLKYSHYLFCFISTISLSTWCVYQYVLDEDLTQTNFKRFHRGKEDVYPSVSLCFMNPYLSEEFENDHSNNISQYQYLQFLQGLYWQPEMTNISYSKVTLNIMNYFMGYDILYRKKGNFIHMSVNDINSEDKGWRVPKENFAEPSMKCFTVDMPYIPNEPIKTFNIRIKTSMFKNNIRPSKLKFANSNTNAEGFGVLFHYPGQLLNGRYKSKKSWPDRDANDSKSYNMVFLLQNIEVINRRNKWKRKCEQFPFDETKEILKNMLNASGCIPPYVQFKQNFPICETQNQMKKSYDSLIRSSNDNTDIEENDEGSPCRHMGRIDYDYWEHGPHQENEATPYFNITLLFVDPKYREIKEVKAFGLLSMFGNIGGYVGIFIGYALLSLPDIIEKAKDFVAAKKGESKTEIQISS